MCQVDSTRDRILEAAGNVFARKGFEAATVREICRLAEANIAAVNYYFGDKRQLYVEAVKRAHAWRVQQAPLPVWPAGTPAVVKLHGFVRTLLARMLCDDPTSWHGPLMLREMSCPDTACRALVSDYIRPEFRLLLEILDELVPAEMPSVRRHLVAFSIVGQCLHYRVGGQVIRLLVPAEEHAGFTADMLAGHITELTLAALGALPPLGQPGDQANNPAATNPAAASTPAPVRFPTRATQQEQAA